MRVFGLTGGIASGKSAVGHIIEEHFPLIEADQVARDVVRPGAAGLAAVTAAFGEDVLQADGTLNRAKLRGIIAADRDAQQRLNGILHPLIRADIETRLQTLEKDHETAFVSAALMLETGSYKRYEAVVLVTAPFDIRLQRLIQRDGMAETAARNLMAKQWPDEKKRELATVEIVNDEDLIQLRTATLTALKKLGLSLSP